MITISPTQDFVEIKTIDAAAGFLGDSNYAGTQSLSSDITFKIDGQLFPESKIRVFALIYNSSTKAVTTSQDGTAVTFEMVGKQTINGVGDVVFEAAAPIVSNYARVESFPWIKDCEISFRLTSTTVGAATNQAIGVFVKVEKN